VNCCITTGLLGCLIPGICNKACSVMQDVTKPIQGPSCDAFRAAGSVDPLLCATASSLDAASCAAVNVVGAPLCVTVQAIKAFYDQHPFAKVSMGLTLADLPFSITVKTAKIDAALALLDIQADAQASGPVRLDIAYERNILNSLLVPPPLSYGQCQVNWQSSLTYSASTQISRELQFHLTASNGDDGSLKLDFVDDREWTAYVDIAPAPLVKLFASTPVLDLSCPLVVLASAPLAVLDRAITKEESRTLWPLLTGEHYPLTLKVLTIPLTIPPIVIAEASGQLPKRTVNPKLKDHGILFSPAS
jgi:hypothetical protein